METGLALQDVTIKAGERSLIEEVTVTFHPGRWYAVLGPNGAGKSTMLRAAAGTLSPDRGSVSLNGESLTSLTRFDYSARVAILPQSIPYPPPFTVKEYLSMVASRYAAGSAIGDALQNALDGYSLNELRDRSLREVSAGQLQKVHVASMSLIGARFLLFDEPTTYLDPGASKLVLDSLTRLKSGKNVGVVMSTHDISAAIGIVDEVLLMNEGRILGSYTPDDAELPRRVTAVFGRPVSQALCDDGRTRLFFS